MNMIFRIILFVFFSLLLPAIAAAHDPFSTSKQTNLPIIFSALLLCFFWLNYIIGALRVWPGWWRWTSFQAAAIIMTFTIFGPLDEWAETNTAAHMTQHMLMIVVIAPLWVLAQPLPQFAASSGQAIIWLWKPLFRIVRYPMLAACPHGAMIWLWHAPKPYLLALENPWWHVIEHACFLISAGLFWWAVLRSTQVTAPRAFLALLFTLMHTGFLGALLTFAHAPLYGFERQLPSQQLAGLIMWVVGGLPYMVAAYWCGERWFRQMMRRTEV
jgi:cytochrome c oxidase assembly factor CtaG